MKLKTEVVRLINGEDIAILVDEELGVPLTHANLFLTSMYRNRSKAVSYCQTVCRDLKLFYRWLHYNEIDLIARFTEAEYLNTSEIERLVDDLKLKDAELSNKYKRKIRKIKKIVNFRNVEKNKLPLPKSVDSVANKTAYTRLLHVYSYLKWLGYYLRSDKTDLINEMISGIKVRMPIVVSDSNRIGNYRALSEIQLRQLLDVIRPDSPNNIWPNESTRFRNYVLINMLTDLGTRRGELLNAKSTNLDIQKSTIIIARDPDNPEDSRKNRPSVKTLGRELDLNEDLCDDLDIYIHKYRSKIKNSDKTEYIFVTHKAGPTEGQPLSISAVKKIFFQLSEYLGFKVGTHDLRHTNADLLYEALEKEFLDGNMTEAQVEDALCYTFGWADGSKAAKTYTQRARDKFTREKQLELQKRNRKERDVGGYDDDVDY
jgi:integrase